ncbi:MAG TPA: hypothetical protein VGM92_12065, partial [Candidatus Kapabacteria bacterium]
LAVIAALRRLSKSESGFKSGSKSDPDSFRLKWPNDIFLHAKKVCGLLLEAQWNGPMMRSAIIGIGVNVKQKEFPDELREIATSLLNENIKVSVEEVRDAILREFERELKDSPIEFVIERLRQAFGWMGTVPAFTWTAADASEKTRLHYGTILDSGALELQTDDGEKIIVSNGSLRW